MKASSGQKKDGDEEKGELEAIKMHAHDTEENCINVGNKSQGHGTTTCPPEKLEDAPEAGTAIATEQMANCANDEASSTTSLAPTSHRGIFKVNRTDQGGRLDEVNECLGNLETATTGGDAPPQAMEVNDVEVLEYAKAVPIEDTTDAQAEIGGDAPPQATEVNDVEVLEYAEAVPIEDATDAQAEIGGDAPPQATEVNDVEVLEYAEAVPIEDTTDAQAEIESLSCRNMCLKHILVVLLIMAAYSVVCLALFILGVFGNP